MTRSGPIAQPRPGDSGAGAGTAGDLRYCVTQANAAGGTNTINFALTGVITLANQLTSSNKLTIQGPGANPLTISGNNTVRVFNIGNGNFEATLADLTIANGKAPLSFSPARGGGINNQSTGTLPVCPMASRANSIHSQWRLRRRAATATR